MTIGDAWGFSGIVLIALSRGFSSKILTGIWLCYGRPSPVCQAKLTQIRWEYPYYGR